jgi:Tfp pilus assembly protein PilF
MFYLARAHEQHGAIEIAERLYRQGFERRASYTDFGVGLARVLLREGNEEQARKLADGIVQKNPNNSDALLVLGLAYQRRGDRKAARNYLERGADLSARDPDFQLALARLAEGDGDLNGALMHYTKAVAIQGAGSEAAERLALLRKAAQ